MKKKIIVTLIIAAVVASSAAFIAAEAYRHLRDERARKVFLERKRAGWKSLRKTLELDAARFKGEAGIVVMDLATGLEISFNKTARFPSASLVKIPLMAVCYQAAREGRIGLDDRLALKASDKVAGSGQLKLAAPGATYTVRRLIGLMVESSDNIAANMLIDALGFEYINGIFAKWKLTHTNLARKMMDFRHRKRGVENYTTPEDIASVLERIYHKRLVSPAADERCLALLRLQQVNDRIPARLPADVPVAHKTGLERNVCHDAGIVFTPRGDVLICVLTRSVNGSREAKKFISKLALETYEFYQGL